MFIVIFRRHGELNCQTQYFGPYDYDAAEDCLIHLGALGAYSVTAHKGHHGEKHIVELKQYAEQAD